MNKPDYKPNKCDFCSKPGELKRLPKELDFSFKHAMTRLGVPLKSDEVQFQKYSYFFESEQEKQEFFRAHPDWYVVVWYYVCPECLPHVRQSPESLSRVMHFIERKVGTEAMDTAIEACAPMLLVEIADKLKKEQKRHDKAMARLAMRYGCAGEVVA